MKKRFCALLLVLASVVGFGADEAVEPAIVLKLKGTITDPAQIDFDSLPKLAGEHSVVCRLTDELKFQLHDYLIHHDGKYWCMFSHGAGGEDEPTQFVSYTTSDDGLHWSEARPIMPAPAAPYAYIARGFWLRDGELLALVAHFRDKGAFGGNKELKLEAYVWDQPAAAWKFKTVLYENAINNFAPQKLASGDWMMTRRDARFSVYMLAGGVKSIEDWQSFPVIKRLEVPKFAPDEPIWWQLPDGRLHALFRDNGGSSRLYQAFSSDDGRTWTRPRITNFPNATSKCYPLRLSSGPWVMLSNANPKWGRREMMLSLSEDGLTFTKMVRLAIPFTRPTTFQYPHAIEHDGHLLVVVSQKKMQSEVLKVPLASIEALRK